MSAKRSSTDEITARKRQKTSKELDEVKSFLEIGERINEPLAAIDHLLSLFPKEQLKLPPIIYSHQIYSLVKNRTKVDQVIRQLREQNKIKSFKIDTKTEDTLLCYTQNLIDYIKALYINEGQTKAIKDLIQKFAEEIISKPSELSYSKSELMIDHNFKDSDISLLIKYGLLTIKDASNWWISIPNIGTFRRLTIEGRSILKLIIRKKKFHEININELVERDLKKCKTLGIMYHCHDIIGNESVQKIDSPMGFLMRYNAEF